MVGAFDEARTDVRGWPGMRSEYSWIPVRDRPTVTGANQVGVAFSGHQGAVFTSAGRTVRSDIAAGSVFVTGDEPIVWQRIGEPTEALEVYPDLDLVRELTTVEPRLVPATAAHDGVVLAICSILRHAHLTGTGLTDVGASTLAHRLTEHLALRHNHHGRVLRPAPGGLTWATVDRVTEYVEAHLAATLTIDRLAAVAGLSAFHFARAFRATTGQSPRQYVMARRMDRAGVLLRTSSAPVAEVAYAVGLSNLSHFRRVFRRHTGMLPGVVRQDRKIGPSRRRRGE